MRNILNIARNDLQVFFADWGNLFGLLFLPILVTVIVGSALGGFGGSADVRLRVDVIDLDESARSQEFIDLLRQANPSLFLCPADRNEFNCLMGADKTTLTEDDTAQRVEQGDTNAAIIIPQGYQDSLESFEPIEMRYYSTAGATDNDAFLQSLQAVVQRANGAVIAARVGAHIGVNFDASGTIFADDADQQQFADAVYDRAENYISQNPVSVNFTYTEAGDTTPNIAQTQGFGQAVPGQGTLFVMFTVLGGLAILVREREQWTLQRLVVMPLSRGQILGGKILFYVSIGMIQYGIVFGVGALIGTDLGSDPVALVLVMLAFVICTTALALALATRITNQSQANGLSFLLAFTLAPLGGAWWPIEIAPSWMQTVGHISPVAWAMDGFRELIFFNGTLVDVLPEIGVLLAASAVLFGIGIMGFRYE